MPWEAWDSGRYNATLAHDNDDHCKIQVRVCLVHGRLIQSYTGCIAPSILYLSYSRSMQESAACSLD